MKKEPTLFYILRLLASLGILLLIAMLYWSSQLQEEDLKEIKNDLQHIESQLSEIKQPSQTSFKEQSDSATIQKSMSTQPDPNLPNLLEDDPFYQTTLPKLLGAQFHPWGTRRGATVGKPKNLHPFSNWSQVSDWNSACNVSISGQLFGRYETMSKDAAYKMEQRKSKNGTGAEYWLFLRNNLFWQPLSQEMFSEEITLSPHFLKKHPVTAHDFKFYYDAMMNQYVQEGGAIALRTYFEAVESVEVIDDYTLVVRWKSDQVVQPDGSVIPKVKYIAKEITGSLKPLARFVYQYFPDGKKITEDDDQDTYLNNSVWAQNFNEHWAKNIIVSCGAWVFEKMSERELVFRRNPDFFEPLYALSQELHVSIKDASDGILQDFKAGKTDSYSLQPEQLLDVQQFLKSDAYHKQAANGLAIKRLDYVARSYQYIGWNQARPYFASKLARRAMTMAIDRKRIIETILNGMGVEISGQSFVRSSDNDSAIKPWPFDPVEARRLLEQDGWFEQGTDGILSKTIAGQIVPFKFALTYYVKNPTLAAICSYVATALKQIGVDCSLNGVDIADLSSLFDEKNFDAIALGWSLGAPPDIPRQLWHSSGAKVKGSSNAIGFNNSEADEIINLLDYVSNAKERTRLYHRFHAIMHEEQPYTFLYTPKTAFLYREYLQNVFIPADRQDLIPGANVEEPQSSIFWLKKQ